MSEELLEGAMKEWRGNGEDRATGVLHTEVPRRDPVSSAGQAPRDPALGFGSILRSRVELYGMLGADMAMGLDRGIESSLGGEIWLDCSMTNEPSPESAPGLDTGENEAIDSELVD